MKKELIAIVGLVLYLFDLGSDIYVAYKYWEDGHTWWFRMTIVCIGVPSIIVNVVSVAQLMNVCSCLASVLQLSIVVRYVQAIFGLEQNPLAFAKLRYVETITESAPQWCLQAYVMLRQWYFPWYTVLSVILSALSLSWSITAVEIERPENTEWNCRKITEKVSFLLWQLFTLVSRLSVIVLFGFSFRYYVVILLCLHWALQAGMMYLLAQGKNVFTGANGSAKAVISSILFSFPSIFHSPTSFAPKQIRKANMILGWILINVENIGMAALCLTFGIGIISKNQSKIQESNEPLDELLEPLPTSVPQIAILEPFVIPILAVTSFFSFIFFVIYYKLANFDNAVD